MIGILAWPHDGVRYHAGFYIGSEDENGNHVRNADGWPLSIYRRGKDAGVNDICVCTGIQYREDAERLANLMNETYFPNWNGKIYE